MRLNYFLEIILFSLPLCVLSACTVKAVGDPKRPITIEAHITIDIKGLKDTASTIEDYVSGEKPKASITEKK